MNLKSIVASVALATSLVIPGAAEAAPRECVFIDGNDVHNSICDSAVRVNANGHNVNDIAYFTNGSKLEFSVIWWQTNGQHRYAEVFMNGKRFTHSSYTAKNGMWCFTGPDWKFCTR